MKISPFDKIICRTPAFGINQTIEEVWEELKSKIEESSGSFYEIIKSYNASDINQLDEKTKFTIWKYFNRSKYRSTPFGSFASLTTIPLSFAIQKPIIIQHKMKAHHFMDWSEKEKYMLHDISDVKYFLSNSSIYFVAQEIRYIKSSNGLFELASVGTLPELNAILLTCKRKTNIASIYELMQYTFDMDEESTTDLLQQLVDLQLLHTDIQANIIGEDYFSKLKINFSNKPNDYIIAERNLLNGAFDGKLLKHLPEMIDFLTKNFKVIQNTDLKLFKNLFIKRFEQQEVSLAIAMDPEIGIGYGNLAQLSNESELIDNIKASKNNNVDENISYGKIQQFLLKKIIAGKSIDLAEFVSDSKHPVLLPNTFSLIFHLYKGNPVLAHTGGCTANSLLGRFTMCNEAVETYAREIAKLETDANIDVLFFDIAYQAEKKVDNVNRRKLLYPYELPILSWSDTNNPLDLTDILVSIERDEVVLKSKKLGKRLVPRIASAYNYTRSDLAVYRFLCDIQSQGLLTIISFKLQDFFPNLEHYPRVVFKGIVISAAQWLLPKQDFKTIDDLKVWLEEKKIDFIFKVGYADQSLSFNPSNEEDLSIFLNYYKQQQKEFYITEALIDKTDFIKDEFDNVFSPQYIANYHHQLPIYNASEPRLNQANEVYLPGSEWLYFEIYSHPSKSNYLLTGIINDFLKSQNKHLKKWFFIRYTDPKPHIRLRLHLKETESGFRLMNTLQKAIDVEMKNGFISDFKLKTYYKETQRYGIKRIHLVEAFFCVNSKYATFLIKRLKNHNLLIINSLQLIKLLCELCFNELEHQILFVKNMAKNFSEEMVLESSNFKKINTEFNEIRNNLDKDIIKLPIGLVEKHEKLFKEILNNCEDNLIKEKILADLIHMLINRLFTTDQRIYETIIYHYLLRISQAKFSISKVQLGY